MINMFLKMIILEHFQTIRLLLISLIKRKDYVQLTFEALYYYYYFINSISSLCIVCYVVFVLQHGGKDLESFVLLNFDEAQSLLVQGVQQFLAFSWVLVAWYIVGNLTNFSLATMIKPSFLETPGMDFGSVYGMQRALSEGDIKTLGNGNMSFIHSPHEQPVMITTYPTKDRREKLSRYRNKKTQELWQKNQVCLQEGSCKLSTKNSWMVCKDRRARHVQKAITLN
ncbi:uncharacterized protein LOC116129361 [Pistacia vera]|uniref:uncharacterized protein LOC116129361 n=1 Tax=Pistacia vera TaxID=55513 RepID=UPI001263C8A5|nr:uncharacterized protein LOC116129361 [Pistacia vera]XP_031270965.1 uncharacterized protein LOC116129361 [Pistacia vera]